MHLVELVESYKAVSRLILILADFARAVLEALQHSQCPLHPKAEIQCSVLLRV